ncbi:MAG TPA: DEAD/DEAH box helicase [Spirochaetota bacterium]|nr:DEAD/DEAH box helicase [Spirochaetota bacterium]
MQLFPYQEEGARFLINRKGALLADQMGLGKTVQAIAAAENFKSKALVVTRAALLKQWRDEIKKFTGKEAVIITGSPAKREKAWLEATEPENKYCICSYDTIKLKNDLKAACKFLAGGTLILDEATAVKNYKSQRTKAIWFVRKCAGRIYALTGTPYENHLTEYYQVLRLVNPSIFPKYETFKHTFLITRKIKVGLREVEIVTGERNLELFRRLTTPVLLRRTRDEVLTLPPSETVKHYVSMNALQLKQEKQLLDEAILTRSSVITVFTHCLQNIISPALINDKAPAQSPLLDEAYEVVKEIVDNGEQAVIFSTFVTALQIFDREYLQKEKMRVAYITGQQKDLDAVEGSGYDCLLISTAGGYGLNLQKYHYMIFLNEPLNPAVTEQVEGRIYRMGQQHNVQYHKIYTENSEIEQRVRELLERKKDISEFLLARYALKMEE